MSPFSIEYILSLPAGQSLEVESHQPVKEEKDLGHFYFISKDLNQEMHLKRQTIHQQHTNWKKTRTVFTRDQIARMESAFEDNKYLTKIDRTDLASSLKLSETQVKIWFQNRRNKLKRSGYAAINILGQTTRTIESSNYNSNVQNWENQLIIHYR